MGCRSSSASTVTLAAERDAEKKSQARVDGRRCVGVDEKKFVTTSDTATSLLMDECRRAIAVALTVNGVPCTYRSALVRFLQTSRLPYVESVSYDLVTRTLTALRNQKSAVSIAIHQPPHGPRQIERMANDLVTSLTVAVDTVLQQTSRYADARLAMRRHYRECFDRARKQLSQLQERQLALLTLQVDISAHRDMQIALPCVLCLDVDDATSSSGIVSHLLSSESDYRTERERMIDEDDAYYERWVNVYRYPHADLRYFAHKESVTAIASPSGTSRLSLPRTFASESTDGDDKKTGRACSKQVKKAKWKRYHERRYDARRNAHQKRMNEIHVRRELYHTSATERRQENDADWVDVRAFRLHPTHPQHAEMLRDRSLAALHGLDKCVGMSMDLRSSSICMLENIWQDLVPLLLEPRMFMVFQFNTRFLTCLAPTDDTRLYCRWKLENVPESMETVAFQPAASDCQSSIYTSLVRQCATSPFLDDILASVPKRCHVILSSDWIRLHDLLCQYITVATISDTLIRGYLGILLLDGADVRLLPRFICVN